MIRALSPSLQPPGHNSLSLFLMLSNNRRLIWARGKVLSHVSLFEEPATAFGQTGNFNYWSPGGWSRVACGLEHCQQRISAQVSEAITWVSWGLWEVTGVPKLNPRDALCRASTNTYTRRRSCWLYWRSWSSEIVVGIRTSGFGYGKLARCFATTSA